MKILRLGGGPTLKLYTDWETEPVEVTDQAHQYLLEPVSVQSSLKVGDIFRLLRICPPLIDIFSRWYAKDFLEHAEKGSQDWIGDFSDNEHIDYLELSSRWYADDETGCIECSDKMCLSGVSIIRNYDKSHHKSSCERINFKISDEIVNYLDLPLRVDLEIKLHGFCISLDGKKRTKKVNQEEIRLGEILEGFFHGISYLGPPNSKWKIDALTQEIQENEVSEVTIGSLAEYISETREQEKTTKIISDKSCRKTFKSQGGVASNILLEAIWRIDDDQNAETSLQNTFRGKVRLKNEYREMNGKSLRMIFSKILKKSENELQQLQLRE
jgi:hypothetical protein